MNPWPYVTAAYVLTGIGAGGLAAWSWIALQRSERK